MGSELLRRIQKRLAAVGLSESGASHKAGLSRDTIRNLRRDVEKGSSRGMNTNSVEKLAVVLETSPQWLLSEEGPEEGRPVGAVTNVPLVSWVSAGTLQEAEQTVSLDDAPRVPAVDLGPGDWIALEVDGDSMNRISPPGSTIFVNRREQRLVPNACYVIATEGGEATYKRYRPDPDRFEPVSTNPDHDPIYPEGRVSVIGRVRRSTIGM